MVPDRYPDISKYPFIIPQKMPYSEISIESNNERVRKIICIHCKYQMFSNMYSPMCGVCNREMITSAK